METLRSLLLMTVLKKKGITEWVAMTKKLSVHAVMPGVESGIESGLIDNLKDLVVGGDGSILKTAASASGKPVCACRSEGVHRCDHDKLYTSPTAQWRYDHHHRCFVSGDRYYLSATRQNGHDPPLRIIMPGGNESDYTLSLKALDPFLKSIAENNTGMRIAVFIEDGHHDSYAHYEHLPLKEIIPIIPLSCASEKNHPHPREDNGIGLDTDGTPLCGAGARMRRHQYDKRKHTHVYCRPVKRNPHRGGKSVYAAQPTSSSAPGSRTALPRAHSDPSSTSNSTRTSDSTPPFPAPAPVLKPMQAGAPPASGATRALTATHWTAPPETPTGGSSGQTRPPSPIMRWRAASKP